MNQNFLITGAAQGLGLEFTRRVVSGGGRVVMTDIAEAMGKESKDELEKEFGKGKVTFIQLDVRDEQRWRQVWDEAEAFFGGKVEVLMNNAGQFYANWKLMVDVNLIGLLVGTMLAMEKMGVSNGGPGGLIIQTASLAGIMAGFMNTLEEEVYIATKWAVVGLTRSMASDKIYQRDRVRMLSICPSMVNTSIVRNAMDKEKSYEEDWKKELTIMEPSEVGDALEKLIEDGKSGQALVVEHAAKYYWPDHNLGLLIIVKILHTLVIIVGRHPRTQPVSTNQMAWAAAAVIFLLAILFHWFLNFCGL